MRNSAELFKALADETRLRILNLLVRGELCVCEIVSVLGIGQSKVSRHLACLRNAGLVDDHREGVWMHYSLARPTGVTHRRILGWLAEISTELPQAAADLKALRAARLSARQDGQCAGGNGQRKPVSTRVERSQGMHRRSVPGGAKLAAY
jgi:ArsR family transcriptional regulator, arsenate/arsenite/antimonite-responsive transcriptional repressor